MNISCLYPTHSLSTVFKQNIQNIYQLQQNMVRVCWYDFLISELLQQIIGYRQQRSIIARQYWSVLACISYSIAINIAPHTW